MKTNKITVLNKGTHQYQFRLIQHPDSYLVEYRKIQPSDSSLDKRLDWHPLELMGKKINGTVKALMADYDLFMVASHLKDIVDTQQLRAVDGQNPTFKAVVTLVSEQALSQSTRRDSDPEIGSVPARLPDYINKLNNEAKESGYQGGMLLIMARKWTILFLNMIRICLLLRPKAILS